MSVVKLDLADGTTFSQSFQQYQALRVAEVSELSGPPSKIITDAIDDPRLPAMGDAHPVYAGMFVTQKTARPVDAQSVRVEIAYTWDQPDISRNDTGAAGTAAPDDPGVIEVGAATQRKKTYVDVKGNQLLVGHTFTDAVNGVGHKEIQAASVDVEVPQHILRQSRKEKASPHKKARRYVGTINQAPIWGYDQATLLCTRLSGVSSDNGKTFDVTYEFQYNADSWNADVLFIEKKSGKPLQLSDIVKSLLVSDPNDPKERMIYQVYPYDDFSGLDLSFGSG